MGTGTGRRAEIKGRRGDEFVKKAEAGQRHASGTSKRQDEMKFNRRHPVRRIFSPRVLVPVPLFVSPFLGVFVPHDVMSFFFIPSPLAPSFLFLSLSFCSRSVELLHIRSTSNPVQTRVKEAEKARTRPERVQGGRNWNPFKGSGGR